MTKRIGIWVIVAVQIFMVGMSCAMTEKLLRG